MNAKASQGTVSRRTAEWLGDIGDKLHRKLVKAGLAEPHEAVEPEPQSEQERMTLATFLSDHINHGRTSQGKPAAESTLAKWIGT